MVETSSVPTVTITADDPLLVPEWDTEVASLPGATVFHGTGWASTLIGTYGYTPFYLTAREQGRVVGVLPLMEARSSLTGVRGVSLPFTDDCDLLATTESVASAIRKRAQELASTQGWRYLEIRSRDGSGAQPSFFSHRTALTNDTEALFRRIHDSTRRSIKKSVRSGVVAAVRNDWPAVEQYYRLHCQARKGHGLPPQTLGFFRRIHSELISKGQGFVVLATHGGATVAGAVFLLLGKQATYKFGASDPSSLSVRPNHLVMWTAMKHAAELGYSSFDFGRTSLWNEGLRFYKTRWASTEHVLRYSRFSPASASWGPVPDGAKGGHTRFFQLLPIPISRVIGAILYKHMA